MKLPDRNDIRGEMLEMGEQVDPVREMLRRMVAEFCDYHYGTCPADLKDDGQCNCFAGALLIKARAALTNGELNSTTEK